MIALYWIQEIHRRTFPVSDSFDSSDLNVVCLRPIAIVPATPSTLDGLCGPGQRNGVGSSFESRGKTLGHRRLFTSGFVVSVYRRSREDLRQRRFSVLTFLRVRSMYRKSEAQSYLRVLHKFG